MICVRHLKDIISATITICFFFAIIFVIILPYVNYDPLKTFLIDFGIFICVILAIFLIHVNRQYEFKDLSNDYYLSKKSNTYFFEIKNSIRLYWQDLIHFAEGYPLKSAQYLLYSLSIVFMIFLSMLLISAFYTYGYAPNSTFGTQRLNNLGIVYKPYSEFFSKTTWLNTVNNSSNNNQNVKHNSTTQPANFADDPANHIFKQCQNIVKNDKSTDQAQAIQILDQTLQNNLLQNNQFYIQETTGVSSYAPTYNQRLEYMNRQKIVNPNYGLIYHNSHKQYTGYLNQPSYQIAHREYFTSQGIKTISGIKKANLGVATGLIHAKNNNAYLFTGEQINFMPTYWHDTLYHDFFTGQSRSNHKLASFGNADDQYTAGDTQNVNTYNYQKDALYPQIAIINDPLKANYQNTYINHNFAYAKSSNQNGYNLINHQTINQQVLNTMGLEYNALSRIYPAMKAIDKDAYLNQLQYSYHKTKFGYKLVVFGNLNDVSDTQEKALLPFHLTYIDGIPETFSIKMANLFHISKSQIYSYLDDTDLDNNRVKTYKSPVQAVDDRLYYEDSPATVAFIIKNGQIYKMAIKIHNAAKRTDPKLKANLNDETGYETDVIDYDPKYDNQGITQISNKGVDTDSLETVKRYCKGRGSYLYGSNVNNIWVNLSDDKIDYHTPAKNMNINFGEHIVASK